VDLIYEYILSEFADAYWLPDGLDIGYGSPSDSRIQIRRAPGDYFEQRRPVDLSRVVRMTWRDRELPFLFDEHCDEIVTWSGQGATINVDIIASSFFFLSGWQEIVSRGRDKFGRFPFSASVQSALDLAEVPVVNYYFDILRSVIERVHGVTIPPRGWGGGSFVSFLSHDVDRLQSGWIEGGWASLRGGSPIEAAGLAVRRAIGRDSWMNLASIAELEQRAGARSTFFVLARKGRYKGVRHADYSLGKRVRRELQAVRSLGGEVGLHGSSMAYVSAEALATELDAVGMDTRGCRMHYLLFDAIRTPPALDGAAVEYDATLGFAESPGFRNGYCRPFHLFDHRATRVTGVLEIPLVLMDTTLSRYIDAPPEAVGRIAARIVEEVARFQGCFGVLWHNNYLSPYKFGRWRTAYCSLLEYLTESGTRFLTGREIAAFGSQLEGRKRG
jgi:peptidoglycan/xylan/chitin deacetylase (PgdA/CDA1 family)